MRLSCSNQDLHPGPTRIQEIIGDRARARRSRSPAPFRASRPCHRAPCHANQICHPGRYLAVQLFGHFFAALVAWTATALAPVAIADSFAHFAVHSAIVAELAPVIDARGERCHGCPVVASVAVLLRHAADSDNSRTGSTSVGAAREDSAHTKTGAGRPAMVRLPRLWGS